MTRRTLSEKALKTTNLLIGMHRPEVAPLLIERGLTNAIIAEGWGLIRAATELRVSSMTSPGSGNRNVVQELQAYENSHLPFIRAVLARAFRAERDHLFNGLTPVEGRANTFTVDLLLHRLQAMENGEAPFEERGPEARAFLRERGLTDEIVAEGVALITALQSMSEPVANNPSLAELRKAEDAMWAFYKEWAAIVRLTIKDGRLLRLCGFKKRIYVRDAEIVEDEDEDESEGEGEVLQVTGATVTSPELPAASKADGDDQAAE